MRLAAVLVLAAGHAVATNATHGRWTFNGAEVQAYEQRVIVVDDAAATFYASQWWSSTGVGYIGLQTVESPLQSVIFSVWDAEKAERGDERTFCTTFGNEGVGHSCRYRGSRLWEPGTTYTMRLELSDGWVTGSVRGDGFAIRLGRIYRPELASLGDRIIAFVENWDRPCATAPPAAALFYPPTSGDRVAAPNHSAPVPECAPAANHPYDGGTYLEIGGDGAFTRADRRRIDAFLPKLEYVPLLRRGWLEALLVRHGWPASDAASRRLP